MSNTRVTLLYRDACNYKTANAIVFTGEPTPELVERFRIALDEQQFLVPGQVALEHPALSNDTFNNGRFPDEEDDHGWVEVGEDDVELTPDDPTDPRTFEEFVVACESVADGWDPMVTINACGGWTDPDLAAQLRGSVDG